MFLQKFNKRGEGGVEDVVRWIIYIGILIAVGIAVVKIVGKFG